MKSFLFFILSSLALLPAIIFAAGSIYLAANGKDGWIFFGVIAVLTGHHGLDISLTIKRNHNWFKQ